MVKTNRSSTDTKTPAASPNPRDKQRSKPTPSEKMMDENDPELAPKVLDKDFMAMTVDDEGPLPVSTLPLVFSNLTIQPSNAFYLMNKVSAVKAMTPDDFFGEHKSSFHSLNRFSKAAAGTDGVPKTNLSLDDYRNLFQQSFPAHKVKNPPASTKAIQHLALRMALADPNTLFSPFAVFWSVDHRLVANDMTTAWLAAYQLFGAPWKGARIYFFPDTVPLAASAAPPATQRKTHFSPTVETVPAPTDNFRNVHIATVIYSWRLCF